MTITSVTAGYMSAMGLHLARGRFINDTDSAANPGVIVINQTLAQRYSLHADPLGHIIA